MPPLPEPEQALLVHSQAVGERIASEINEQGGWIPFSRFMELALYAPGLGYYSAGLDKFGAGGDFVTAPEISPLFGQCLARQAAQVLQLTDGDVLEIGAGSGRLAVDLMRELENLGTLPARYAILELSGDLRQRQQALIEQTLPHLAARFHWLDALPERFGGIMLGNEVLDAMPVHLVSWQGSEIVGRGVGLEQGRFVWLEKKLEPGELLDVAMALPPAGFSSAEHPYVSEIHLAAQGFVRSLGNCLEEGIILMLDYGFPESEYYHPQRGQGTLMCHYRHHAHSDPFFLPGLQDITAHVDFSAMIRAGLSSGLENRGYATQAQFLLQTGLTDLLARLSPEDGARYLPAVAQAQKLVSPAEMGELFKVLALGKGVEVPLMGFIRTRVR
ncbi:MAG: SAM-dependent methyltransferase [Sulfuricellaceae bacterium]|nr:SAM-dependent methyltransferase [Sulfuricellaceae bacterium]